MTSVSSTLANLQATLDFASSRVGSLVSNLDLIRNITKQAEERKNEEALRALSASTLQSSRRVAENTPPTPIVEDSFLNDKTKTCPPLECQVQSLITPDASDHSDNELKPVKTPQEHIQVTKEVRFCSESLPPQSRERVVSTIHASQSATTFGVSSLKEKEKKTITKKKAKKSKKNELSKTREGSAKSLKKKKTKICQDFSSGYGVTTRRNQSENLLYKKVEPLKKKKKQTTVTSKEKIKSHTAATDGGDPSKVLASEAEKDSSKETNKNAAIILEQLLDEIRSELKLKETKQRETKQKKKTSKDRSSAPSNYSHVYKRTTPESKSNSAPKKVVLTTSSTNTDPLPPEKLVEKAAPRKANNLPLNKDDEKKSDTTVSKGTAKKGSPPQPQSKPQSTAQSKISKKTEPNTPDFKKLNEIEVQKPLQKFRLRRMTFNSIPFVAGKSVSKSHNLGINIQETLSKAKRCKVSLDDLVVESDGTSLGGEANITINTAPIDEACPAIKPDCDYDYNPMSIETLMDADELWAPRTPEQEDVWVFPEDVEHRVKPCDFRSQKCVCLSRKHVDYRKVAQEELQDEEDMKLAKGGRRLESRSGCSRNRALLLRQIQEMQKNL